MSTSYHNLEASLLINRIDEINAALKAMLVRYESLESQPTTQAKQIVSNPKPVPVWVNPSDAWLYR